MVEHDDASRQAERTDAPLSTAVLVQLLRTIILEQRRRRRSTTLWRLFSLLLLVVLFTALTTSVRGGFGGVASFPGRVIDWSGGHAAVVHLDGVILAGEPAAADLVVAGLRDAFAHEQTRAVVLAIDSPGGSPVQADLIHEEILRLRTEYSDTPIYAVVGDTGVSAAYYVAVAADSVYAARASLIGSIGVVYNGFGLSEALAKFGVERRLVVAGEDKGFLDPFSPLSEASRADLQAMLDIIHQQFIERVRAGRGDRLVSSEQLFSGKVWTGEQALELGLIDALGSVDFVVREVVETESSVDFTRQEELTSRLLNRFASHFAQRLSALLTGLR